ncbi:MAG: Acetyl xylan esterase [Verrucomicrobia bacterium]|nr:Acetyl xylan esterase [Verrucomicrobiota bacterium]
MSFNHSFPFDPTYGYDLAALRCVAGPPEPADFADFWRGTFEEAARVPLDLALAPSALRLPNAAVFDISFNALGGARIHGWLTRPETGPITRGLVIGHGYGSREEPDEWLPAPQAAAIFPCARGLSRSAGPAFPSTVAAHVLHGITARGTYIHRGCAADLWAAASALLEVVPAARRQLDYVGSSFGGGIGALALPWDARFQKAHLGVPSFGHHPLRVTLPSVGSGEAIRTYARTHPGVLDVLRYFDAATAARHLRIPVQVVAAPFDPAVPPPGQFAVYNALSGPKELVIVEAAHFPHPGEAEETGRVRRALEAFLLP